ncbi:hypothetical protein E2C01_099884 [Portunus trituberculatus]|uniref:Uncharacterized protein n=1 Tax=Portunus trituberculatus TaxID=210409 RepID=A0A5B7KAN5_PORTR|nr:hypothetical protein [Portunus trituberculatus]
MREQGEGGARCGEPRRSFVTPEGRATLHKNSDRWTPRYADEQTPGKQLPVIVRVLRERVLAGMARRKACFTAARCEYPNSSLLDRWNLTPASLTGLGAPKVKLFIFFLFAEIFC